jgi:diketogulonate reductase-like aldo/keto reductase
MIEIIKKAILVDGYRHIDCAMLYGNEEEIGVAFQECFAAGIKREDLFITCKLWNTEKNDVEGAVNASLKRLQLDYLDLYLIHWIWPGVDYGDGSAPPKLLSPPTHVVWKHMEEQVKKGKIRSIGISNASVPVLLDLLAGCEIPPAVNQIEVHPYFQ